MENKKYPGGRYSALMTSIFLDIYKPKSRELRFSREDIVAAATKLGMKLPKNIGDVIYSFRYRNQFPAEILATQPNGYEWIIVGAGKSEYLFKLVPFNRILPNSNILSIKIPDATPEIISRYALGDEQALLAKVRYNRLIDVFLGIAAYSLQNHLRTTVKGVGQIEIDEVYVAVDKHGRQFIIPVQAKGGSDQHGVVQTTQDILWCKEKFPELICRPVSVQFITATKIAMFSMAERDGIVGLLDEKHYELVDSTMVTINDLQEYSSIAEKD